MRFGLVFDNVLWSKPLVSLQCKTQKWRQDPIYGSIALKIDLWAYLTYPHTWLKEQEENKKIVQSTSFGILGAQN